MFISLCYKDATTSKKVMRTLFFERTMLLWDFEEDDEKKVTKITKLVLKIDNLGDERLSEAFTYVKFSKKEYAKFVSNIGISQYGAFYLHTTLKYKKLEYDPSVFAEESITLPGYVEG